MAIVNASNFYINTNCYSNCRTITSIDLKNTPWVNNSMYNAFYYCNKLESVTNINNKVTNMSRAFWNCYKLNTPPVIPNSVTTTKQACYYCNSLTEAPVIPNSVINMQQMFWYCTKINSAPVIPNSVINMSGAFSFCKLPTPPTIPNSVTDIYDAFSYNNTMSGTVTIPPSVINACRSFYQCNNTSTLNFDLTNATNLSDMNYMFGYCNILTNFPKVIPVNVHTMAGTFVGCANMGTCDIAILSENVTYASDCFSETGNNNKYVWIKPNTTTWNTFISAGYDTNGTQNKVFMREWDGTFSNLTVNVTPNTAIVNIVDVNDIGVTRIFNVNAYSHANVYTYSFIIDNVNYMSNYDGTNSTFTVSLPNGNYNVISDLAYTGGYMIQTLNVSNNTMYMNCDGYSNNPITVVNGTQLVAGGGYN